MLKKIIDEVVNYETFSKSLISSIGYGLGFIIPTYLKFNTFVCIILCIVVGTIFDRIAEYIMDSDIFTGTLGNRIITTGVIYILYLIAWMFFDYYLEYDLDIDFLMDIACVFLFQVIALVVNVIKKHIAKNNKKN